MAAQFQRAKEIFLEAVDKTDPAQREAYLREACAGDGALRAQIDALLRRHEEAGSFLESPPTSDGATVDSDHALEPSDPADQAVELEVVGSRIGHFRLVQRLGEGGMGVVWVAEQEQPVRRRVALKVIKAGMDTVQVIRRFEAERQALAVLDHPHIAKVLDAGSTAVGRPYFVMELVKGIPITQYCDEMHLSVRDRLALFIPVCHAIQHAHQKGIIHRDIKPSNVLVAMQDGVPAPKVIDFGVAKALQQKLTEQSLYTELGAVIGTFEYMSPEQAELRALDIDTRADLYALGVLLYELLTGTTPLNRQRLRHAAYAEMLRLIREEDPPKPSTRLSESKETLAGLAALRRTDPARLSKEVRGDLDWIVMKCLEKDRTRRYESASGLARDIERHLHDEPVEASPPGAAYRLRKFARRNQRGLITGAMLAVAVLVAAGALGWAIRDRENRREELARQAERQRAATEEAVRRAVEQGTRLHDELHAQLRDRGSMELLNQPARWRAQIQAARSELVRAQELAQGTTARLTPELSTRLQQLQDKLDADEADYRLAMRLEQIRLDMIPLVPGKAPDYVAAERGLSSAFAAANMAVTPGTETELAHRIVESPIRYQLLAALDLWANVATRRQPELANRLLAVGQLVDPDPLREQVRDSVARRDARAMKDLADLAMSDPERIDRLSPQFFSYVGTFLQGDHKVQWLRQAQIVHPADFWINLEIGAALTSRTELTYDKDKSLNCIGYLRAALALRPDNKAVLNSLGNELTFLGDRAGALAAYRKAVAIDPEFYIAWNNLGALHTEDLSAAVDAFKRSLAINPQQNNVWFNLGVAYLYQREVQAADLEAENLSAAVDAFKRSLAINPRHLHSWYAVGLAYIHQRDFQAADEAYKKVEAIDPTLGRDARVRFEAVKAGIEKHERVRATHGEQHIDTLLALRELALEFLNLEAFEHGERLLLQALTGMRAQPDHVVITCWTEDRLIELYLAMEKKDAARELVKVRLERGRGLRGIEIVSSLFRMGELMLEKAMYEEVEPVLRELIAAADDSTIDSWRTLAGHVMLGTSLLRQKKYSDAESSLVTGYNGLKSLQGLTPDAKAQLRIAEDRLAELNEVTGRKQKASQ